MNNHDQQPQFIFNNHDRFIFPITSELDITYRSLSTINEDDNQYQLYLKRNILSPLRLLKKKTPRKMSFKEYHFRSQLHLDQRLFSNTSNDFVCSREYKSIKFNSDRVLSSLDWSSQNFIAIADKRILSCWKLNNDMGETFIVFKSCLERQITNIKFDEQNLIAVGDNQSAVHVINMDYYQEVRKNKVQDRQKYYNTFQPHQQKITSLSWKRNLLASGCINGFVSIQDVRVSKHIMMYQPHRYNTSQLKWNNDGTLLASAGGENLLVIFDIRNQRQLVIYENLHGAHKSVDWCPHSQGVIIAAGSKSSTLDIYNMKDLQTYFQFQTQSPIYKVAFAKYSNQVLTCHAQDLSNQISIWERTKPWKNFQNFKKSKSLRGLAHPVMYLAKGPDGKSILTGNKEKTIRFWHAFQSYSKQDPLQINYIR